MISGLSQNCLTRIVAIFRIGSDTEFGIPWNSVKCIICMEKHTFNLSCFSTSYLSACIQWCVKCYISGNFCFLPSTRTPFEHASLRCQAAYFPQLYQFLQSQRNLSTPSRSKRLSWLAGRSSWSVLQNTEEKKTLRSFQNTIDSVFPGCFLRRLLLTCSQQRQKTWRHSTSVCSRCLAPAHADLLSFSYSVDGSNQSMSECSGECAHISSAISNWLPH